MPDILLENISTGALTKVSGSLPLKLDGAAPGGSYRRYLLGSASNVTLAGADRLGIVCWGDSLTAGAGSDTSSDYVAQAMAALPNYQFARMGYGGWKSDQIAARMGARPLIIDAPALTALAALPGQRIRRNFASGAGGFAVAGLNSVQETKDGKLRYVGTGHVNLSIWASNPPSTIAADGFACIRAVVTKITPGLTIQVGYHNNNSFVGTAQTITAAGVYEWITAVPSATPRLSIAKIANADLPNWEVEFDSIDVEWFTTQPQTVAVEKNLNILGASGAYYGTLRGKLNGVYGLLSTDASGNWSFQRRQAGPAIAANPTAVFEIEGVHDTINQTHWLWAGRNNTAADVPTYVSEAMADIAAMVAILPHDRYLIGSVINGGGEYAGSSTHSKITALNAALAGLYGPRFVDVRTPLVAAGDPIADAADIAGDTTPSSLRFDGIHLTSDGYRIVAGAFVAAHKAMGW